MNIVINLIIIGLLIVGCLLIILINLRRGNRVKKFKYTLAKNSKLENERKNNVIENVQFTVYHPKIIQPQRWYPLLIFTHLSEYPLNSLERQQDPIEEVKEKGKKILGKLVDDYNEITQDSAYNIPQKGEITFVPNVPGIEFYPTSKIFHWQEYVQKEEFYLRASINLEGKIATGKLIVFLGSIILAEIKLTIKVDSNISIDESLSYITRNNGSLYRKIFASYSHKDLVIVEEFEQYARALGDEYIRDIINIRAGEVWNEKIKRLIDNADIFQLFWSWNSIKSNYVEKEWRYALTLNRPYFIRPVYWEEPFPEIPEKQLPPEELRKIHFQKINIFNFSSKKVEFNSWLGDNTSTYKRISYRKMTKYEKSEPNKGRITYIIIKKYVFSILFFTPFILSIIILFISNSPKKRLISFFSSNINIILEFLFISIIINLIIIILLFFINKNKSYWFSLVERISKKKKIKLYSIFITIIISILYSIMPFINNLKLLKNELVLVIFIIPKLFSVWIGYIYVRWIVLGFLKLWAKRGN